LIEGQPEGAKFKQFGYGFASPNGWSFSLGVDPGVVEVQMSPMTWTQFAHYSSDIQDAIFASASNVGYFPPLFTGGGHINIGAQVLTRHSLLLFRNLLADLINHSELFMGIFGYDTNNALPFPLLTEEVKERVLGAFENFDRGHIGLAKMILTINSAQKSSCDPYNGLWDASCPRDKATGFSLGNIEGRKGRLELRGVRPQASMDVWVRQIRLLAKRIEYLRRKRVPIAIKPIVRINADAEWEPGKYMLNPPVNPQRALHAFHRYVIESGERWQDHKDYLWPKWITDGEVQRYEQSVEFKDLQQQSCANALEVAI
jgi:hypothetical protein